MKKNENTHKDMATLYYNLYIGCLKYQTEKKTKEVNCHQYYTEFIYFTDKHFERKETKN